MSPSMHWTPQEMRGYRCCALTRIVPGTQVGMCLQLDTVPSLLVLATGMHGRGWSLLKASNKNTAGPDGPYILMDGLMDEVQKSAPTSTVVDLDAASVPVSNVVDADVQRKKTDGDGLPYNSLMEHSVMSSCHVAHSELNNQPLI